MRWSVKQAWTQAHRQLASTREAFGTGDWERCDTAALRLGRAATALALTGTGEPCQDEIDVVVGALLRASNSASAAARGMATDRTAAAMAGVRFLSAAGEAERAWTALSARLEAAA